MTPSRDSLRVLHVIPSVAPRYGGPSMVIGPLVNALNEVPGVRAEIATTDADGPGGRLVAQNLPVAIEDVHLCRRIWSERWKYSYELGRWLRRHSGDYDVMHVHALWSYASMAAGREARRAGVPYIVRPAGMLSPYSFSRRTWSKRISWQMFERSTVQGASAFHVTSHDEAAEVTAVRHSTATFIIPNGIQEGAWSTPEDAGLLRRLCGARAGDRPILLFLSRLHPKKGVTDLLLPAVARMRSDVFLAIAGGVDPHSRGYDDEVRATVERLDIGDRVALLGPVDPAERWNLFDGADLFVLPSWSENFGIVVTEAMARRCPVVVTEGVHSRTIVAEADAGRIVPPDPEALASAFDELMAAPELRARMGCRGRAYVETHLRWPSIAQSLVDAYQYCLAAN